MLALSLGTLIVLSLFRTLTLALGAQEEAWRQIESHRHARELTDWIGQLIQSAEEIRALGSGRLELSGRSEAGQQECVGLFLQPQRLTRNVILYERRRLSCSAKEVSTGGIIAPISDPRISIVRLELQGFDAEGRQAAVPQHAVLVEFALALDADNDAKPDYELTQRALLRIR